ncbi:MAG: hypothetical protein JWN31_1553 [Frankiales bacterium]|nr:hypothetical protein [Frankiales bacterium]
MIGWFDGSAGASGDMLLGALVGAGVPLTVLQQAIDPLALGITLVASDVTRAGLGAVKVDVLAPEDATARAWADIQELLPDGPALVVFARLAAAEAAVHRVPVEEVHFHEVGGLDAIADIVGVSAGLAHLGLTELHCSTLSLGRGSTRGAHGPLPVPVPAVLELLQGCPVSAGPVPHESTTPTGAALLATAVTHWGPMPGMTVTAVGMGAGGRDPDEVANVLRLVVGESLETDTTQLLLEANVDDLDPRLWPEVLAQLMTLGASDAWLTPILMKKGRPAHTLSVLCTRALADVVRDVVFRETSTIGMREQVVTKHALERTESSVTIDGQVIRVKTAWLSGEAVNAMPEWDDVVTAAHALGRPAKQVLAQAISVARPSGSGR